MEMPKSAVIRNDPLAAHPAPYHLMNTGFKSREIGQEMNILLDSCRPRLLTIFSANTPRLATASTVL
jgi:hypothetical protein